jgi:hypothetical protein
MWLLKHILRIVGWLLLLVIPAAKAAKELLGLGGTFDFVISRFNDPAWVGVMLSAIFNPPPWAIPLSIILGLALIWLDLKRPWEKGRSAGTGQALPISPLVAPLTPSGSPPFMLQAFAEERAEMVRLVARLKSGFSLTIASRHEFENDIRRMRDLLSLFPNEKDLVNCVDLYLWSIRFSAHETACLKSISAAITSNQNAKAILDDQYALLSRRQMETRDYIDKHSANIIAHLTMDTANRRSMADMQTYNNWLNGLMENIEIEEGLIFVRYTDNDGIVFPAVDPISTGIKKINKFDFMFGR